LEGPFSAFLGFIAAGAGAGFLGGCAIFEGEKEAADDRDRGERSERRQRASRVRAEHRSLRKTLGGPRSAFRATGRPRPRGDRASAAREAATAARHTEEPIATAAPRLASPRRRPRARSRSRASRGLGGNAETFAMRGTALRRATRDARRRRDRPPRGRRYRERCGHAPCWRAGTAFVAARFKEGESVGEGRPLRIAQTRRFF